MNSERKNQYGPEVKYKRGLEELFEALTAYEEPEGSSVHPEKVLRDTLSSGNCLVLEVGSGWEKEALDAVRDYGNGVTWVALNPMLADQAHNQRVVGHIEEHAFKTASQRVLDVTGIEAPKRRSLAAVSNEIPLKAECVDLIIASWSVPTVIEEQIASMKQFDCTVREVENALQHEATIISETCAEYNRLIRPGGYVITFPIRDPEIVAQYIAELDNAKGGWKHTVCKVYDPSWYAEINDEHVNYLVVSNMMS